MASSVAKLIGKRSKRGSIDPLLLLEKGRSIKELLHSLKHTRHKSIQEVKEKYAATCRLYYSLAAVSRRTVLDENIRSDILATLFMVRNSLENSILEALGCIADEPSIMKAAASKTFFGSSAKQGVSIRFPLMSCTPTKLCGGRCYAHDGRDREIHIIFRACLNYYLADKYERGSAEVRNEIFRLLQPAIKYGIDRALFDQSTASKNGYIRAPRIRFSHIGDMVRTPDFSNHLAKEIKNQNQSIDCIMYTRRPDASKLDSNVFIINFSVDGPQDIRINFAPEGSRIVCSGWDGVATDIAEVTFLEHHVEKASIPKGQGWICPVTLEHDKFKSCDEARCDKCFLPVKNKR